MAIATSKENLNSTEISNLVASGALRDKLTANRTYYVATTGLDTNDGLTVGTAFLTLQKAFDTIADELDLAGFIVTIEIQAGTYTDEDAIFNGAVGGSNLTDSSVIITANGAVTLDQTGTSQAITILEANCAITIEDIAFTAPPAGFASSLISVISSVYVEINNCSFDNQNRSGIFVESSRVDVAGVNLTNSVAYSRFISYSKGSYGRLTGTATPTGTPNFNSEFLRVSSGSTVEHVMTGTGMTGDKINVQENSHVSTTAGFLFLPGDVDGTYDETSSFNGDHGLKFNNAIRERLTADRTYYVDPAGSDTNDGLTVGTPFLTIQKACDVVFQNTEVLGKSVVIQLADGTYPDPSPAFTVRGNVNIGGMGAQQTINRNPDYNGVEIRGNTATPQNVIIEINDCNYGFYVDGHTSNLWINGMTFTRTAGAASVAGAITVNDQSKVYVSNVSFGEIPSGSCMEAFGSSEIILFGTSELTMDNSVADYFAFLYAEGTGCSLFASTTFTTPPALNISFATNSAFITLNGSSKLTDSFSTWTPGAGTTFPTRPIQVHQNSDVTYFPSALDFSRYPGTLLPEISPTSAYNSYTINNSTNAEVLSGAKTLFRYFDAKYQHYTVAVDQAITLDTAISSNASIPVNNNYIITNDSSSTGNLVINGGLSTITPGTQGGFIYTGTTWRTI